MNTIIQQRVNACRQGINPAMLAKMSSGWAVLADVQVLNGYCLLLPDPVPTDLNALSIPERVLFLRDMTIIGDALLEATTATHINYEILGNSEMSLYAHIIPRYAAEPEELRKGPVWFYDWSRVPHFDPRKYKSLMDSLRTAIEKRNNLSR